MSLPSRAWVSLGLATMIAAAALLVRLRQRRRAHLTTPIPIRTDPVPTPVPASLRPADAAGARQLDLHPKDSYLTGVMAAPPKVPAPIAVTADGEQISLFHLPGPGVALHGDGAQAAARAVVVAALSTGLMPELAAKCGVVTTMDTLARLLPPDVRRAGLDPHHEGFAPDDRFVILADVHAAVTHLEE
ncbi:hypothetical protein [Micromonospora sp. CPCC 206061]|uniref:hypothetical protein n=1 Tax=Micromonospora sp. CPCC 206061 TaxID=3122410 RepID=UPI002FF39332